MLKRNKEIDSFTVSFLDVASCGFGAVVILLMIVKPATPNLVDSDSVISDATIAELQVEIFQIRGETSTENSTLEAKREQLSSVKDNVARLRRDLNDVRGEFLAASDFSEDITDEIGEMYFAQQSLTEEIKKLSSRSEDTYDQPVFGIPIDSEYVIFIIDTSGSMTQIHWAEVINLVSDILTIYPEIKGIQVMNDQGTYMFNSTRGDWIIDSPQRRRDILSTLRSWSPFSDSNPVKGITEAISTFYRADKNISMYVFSDDFDGVQYDINQTLMRIDSINREDSDGNRLVRIHSVAFKPPANLVRRAFRSSFEAQYRRFANFMRELAQRNGGQLISVSTP